MRPFSLAFFLFCAVLFPLYFLAPKRARWGVLLAFSVLFSAAAGWQSLCVMALLCLITYCFGRRLGARVSLRERTLAAHRADGSWDKPTRLSFRDACVRREKSILTLGILLQLSLLFVFKYLSPAAAWFSDVTGLPSSLPLLMLPPGLSYVTLSAVSYLCDVARGQLAPEKDFFRVALFLFYFPQMWQGPINRYGELAPQLFAPHDFDGTKCLRGLLRVLWGGLKKLVIADTAAIAVGAILQSPETFGGSGVWLLIVLYSLQIYADFTGGMDMALGLSHVLGIELYENFDHPFSSPTPGEYWRRWHRSMGRFFTDYVFYPLSTGRAMQAVGAWTRKCFGARLGARFGARVPLYLATLATWLLTGLWHGAGWNFVVWGLCNGVLLLLWQALASIRRAKKPRRSRLTACLGCVVTFFAVGLFRTLDVYRSVGLTFTLWGRALLPSTLVRLLDAPLWAALGLNIPQWCLLALGVLLMWGVSRSTPRVGVDDVPSPAVRLMRRPFVCALLCALGVTALLVLGQYGLGFDTMDFIYGQY